MDVLELNNHLILTECFKEHLKEENKPKVYTYPSTYNSNTNYINGQYARDRCDCKFYEWSDLNREPKKFNRGKDFFEYLDSCHISYTQRQKNEFETYYTFFATCVQGESRLLLTHDLKLLKDELNKEL